MPAILYWLDFFVVPALMALYACYAWPLSDGNVLSFVFAGYLSWVFFEYVLHRWVFHTKGSPYWWPHVKHHHHPFDPTGMPTPGLAPVALFAVGSASCLLLGAHFGSSWAVGFLGGYMTYIVTHHLIHNGTLTGPIAQRHELHHKHWAFNYNLMCPLGDLLFGTYKEVTKR